MSPIRLYIPCEGRHIAPANGLLAVVSGYVTDNVVHIEQPSWAAAELTAPVVFCHNNDPSSPFWLVVERSYAGLPRRITREEYVEIWRNRWFAPSGLDKFTDGAQITLCSGVEVYAREAWLIFTQLRMLFFFHEELFHNLGLTTYNQEHDVGQIVQMTYVSRLLADRTLNGLQRVLTPRGRKLMQAFIEPVEPESDQYQLVAPWARQESRV